MVGVTRGQEDSEQLGHEHDTWHVTHDIVTWQMVGVTRGQEDSEQGGHDHGH